MKKLIRYGKTLVLVMAITVVVALLLLLPTTRAEPLDTYHSSWHLVRAMGDEDGASFAAVYDLTGVGTTNGDFASMDSGSVVSGGPFHIATMNSEFGEGYSHGSKWMFSICGKNYNAKDDTFSYTVVGWAKTNGMLQEICSGTGALGTQAVVTYPDGTDALGELVSETSVAYTHASTKFTVTNEGFDGVVAGMLARITGTGYTNEIIDITTVTDSNNIVVNVSSSSTNGTDSTVQINPAFWADTVVVTDLTRWPLDVGGDGANPQVYNSTNNEVAFLVLDLTGLEYIQFIIYGADAATGEQSGDIRVYGRRF